ncbi:MAG TPA: DUF5658 family protein [Allosphingosinicella sp.]|uniref:DUF5658 family protein n=1 Tax=Allosphingosinicella sp. TaxID=2823234 RepID=UPI002ED7D237
MLILLIALFLALQIADLALTLRGLAIGKRERNPLALFFMRHMGQTQGLVLLKLSTLALTAILLAQLPERLQIACLAVFSVIGLLVVLHNIRVIRRGKRTAR